MSDYLGNLVARTLSPTTGVRPLLPSRFEPLPAPVALTETRDIESPAPAEPRPAIVGLQSPTTPGVLDHQVLWHPSDPPPRASSPRGFAIVSHPASVSDPLRPQGPRAASLPTDESRQPDTETAELFQTTTSHRIIIAPDTTPPTGDAPDAPLAVTPAVTNEQPSGPPPVASVAVANPRDHGLRKDVAPAVASPRVFPMPTLLVRSPRQMVGEVSKSSPTEPFSRTTSPNPLTPPRAQASTINVTIGRVEVRATPPSTSSSGRPSVTTPVMSLEEYLSRRAAGDSR